MTSHLFDHLEGFSEIKMSRLYDQPSAALAIFRRMLPHLAKSFVMAMLFMKEPLPIQDLTMWVRPKSRREKEEAVVIMQRLQIMKECKLPGTREWAYKLLDAFAKSLRLALTGGGSHHSFGVPCSTPDPHPVSVTFLDEFARSKWEGVLGYMVSSSDGSGRAAALGMFDVSMVDANVRSILEEGGLIKMSHGRPLITKDGFAFVLQETNTQVWKVLLQYAEAVERREELNMEPVDVLSFIFLLSSLELGQDYSTTTLTPTQVHMLSDLQDFGITYQHPSSSSRFYPTRLATTLTSDSGALVNSITGSATADPSSADPAEKGFIILETNFRLYAYTSSPLQIAVLALFAKLSSKYPNLVTGKLSRKSLSRAVKLGITSAQIIAYLATHAHPQMRKRNAGGTSNNPTSSSDAVTNVLPPTVVDSIQLWQLEDERMKATEGFLFRDFDSKAEYERPCKHAETLGVLVWKNDRKRMFFVWKEKEVVDYITKIQKRRNEGEDVREDE